MSSSARKAIERATNLTHVSVGSLWEIAIKVSLKKLELGRPYSELLGWLEENEFTVLDAGFGHLVQVAKLPFHHRDPFDRIIIAQGLAENFSIISNEAVFDKYGVRRIW